MKSIIKLLGLSIGCSCTCIHAQNNIANELKDKDAIILTTVSSTDNSEGNSDSLASLQDIGKLYAL
ncbi:hypothetical protein [Flavobacterium sp.]|uniref:hypothetical protein n=1 Tax=Flavobacterium sp. TaxID=239 RepID=UPI0012188A33|nr:hypothetical protein [Flavobacterium sp.]RZJ70499.1 MAG: hypothetical protein EOO49_13650 [Flavobacterium sp.]